jgi:hypothetical protein
MGEVIPFRQRQGIVAAETELGMAVGGEVHAQPLAAFCDLECDGLQHPTLPTHEPIRIVSKPIGPPEDMAYIYWTGEKPKHRPVRALLRFAFGREIIEN